MGRLSRGMRRYRASTHNMRASVMRRGSVESLESRQMMATNVFLDFGFDYPLDAALASTPSR